MTVLLGGDHIETSGFQSSRLVGNPVQCERSN